MHVSVRRTGKDGKPQKDVKDGDSIEADGVAPRKSSSRKVCIKICLVVPQFYLDPD